MPDRSSRLATLLAARSRRLVTGAVVLMSSVGWLGLIVMVAGGQMPGALGPGMAPIVPVLDRLAAALPRSAAGLHDATMPALGPWGVVDILLVLMMWVAMVLAMMLPTAAATFRAYADLGGRVVAGVIAGYTIVWLGFSAIGTGLQAALTALGALSPHMAPAGTALSASILIAAGIYQFTPLKRSCLIRCRNPYPAEIGEPDGGLAVRVGFEEGLACLGCCWAMMIVMFAAGLMNLVAMAFLGALMGIEKLAKGMATTYGLGVVLVLTGLLLAGGLFFR
jgi:predicted metal-binding membrane protein